MNRWTKASLIALRIVVGWHFLYEGLWKIDSDTGSTSYSTARHPLQTTTARLRDHFERTPQLKLDAALAQVDAWHDSIVRAFAAQRALGEDQKSRLAVLRDTVKLAAVDAVKGEIPPAEVVDFDWQYVHEEVLKIPPEPAAERFSSLGYLRSSAGPFRPLYRGMVHDIDGIARLTVASIHSRIDRRHREILKHYADAGTPFTPEQQKRLEAARDAVKASAAAMLSDAAFHARIADYKAMKARVDQDASRLDALYSRERLDADRTKLDAMADELLAFVNEPISELAVQTHAIATVAQMAAGPLPRPSEPAGWIDSSIKWALTAIGACLILGLFTPVAALAAAGQLAMFYLASPPWPGLPAATLGGHYLYVDRNMIELIAALVIATTATGRWAGLDAYLEPLIRRRRTCAPAAEPAQELAEATLRS